MMQCKGKGYYFTKTGEVEITLLYELVERLLTNVNNPKEHNIVRWSDIR
jgi:hypothetical protein